LFLKIAEEEKSIWKNPAERTTEILRRVFGSVLAQANADQLNGLSGSNEIPGLAVRAEVYRD
jgi:myo-inositol-hexaphosphate 3-phosphohydrolase